METAASVAQPTVWHRVRRALSPSIGLVAAAVVWFAWPSVCPAPPHVASYSRADHEKAARTLAAATDRAARADALIDMAKTTVYFGALGDANGYATELLEFAASDATAGRRVDGNAIHDGHEVLGLVALRRGNLDEAKRQLLLAGDTPGSPQLGSFGPNMLLAKELLERGERDAVIEYFRRCGRFWKMERGRVDQWTKDARARRAPDFGANLLF